MHSDPIHQYRSMLTREMLTTYRACRQQILRTIRDELTKDQRSVPVGELSQTITSLLNQVSTRSSRSTSQFISLLYQRGIDRTISEIIFSDRTVCIDARFSRSDQEMILGLSEDATQSIADLHDMIRTFASKAVSKAEKNRTGVNKAIKEIYEQYNSRILPVVETLCASVACRAYNAAAHRMILQYAPGKKWMGNGDGYTRASHTAVIGTVIPATDRFEIPEIVSSKTKAIPACQIRYPGDTCGSPPSEQIAGCRCWIVPAFDRAILTESVTEPARLMVLDNTGETV